MAQPTYDPTDKCKGPDRVFQIPPIFTWFCSSDLIGQNVFLKARNYTFVTVWSVSRMDCLFLLTYGYCLETINFFVWLCVLLLFFPLFIYNSVDRKELDNICTFWWVNYLYFFGLVKPRKTWTLLHFDKSYNLAFNNWPQGKQRVLFPRNL